MSNFYCKLRWSIRIRVWVGVRVRFVITLSSLHLSKLASDIVYLSLNISFKVLLWHIGCPKLTTSLNFSINSSGSSFMSLQFSSCGSLFLFTCFSLFSKGLFLCFSCSFLSNFRCFNCWVLWISIFLSLDCLLLIFSLFLFSFNLCQVSLVGWEVWFLWLLLWKVRGWVWISIWLFHIKLFLKFGSNFIKLNFFFLLLSFNISQILLELLELLRFFFRWLCIFFSSLVSCGIEFRLQLWNSFLKLLLFSSL